MRIARWFSIAVVLLLGGCLLTSGQFAISFDLFDPLVVSGPTAVGIPVYLDTIDEYNNHKDDIKDLADVALLGEITNNSSTTTLPVEFWMPPDLTPYTTDTQVRSDPTAVRLWGPFTLAPSQVARIDWDKSAGLFTGRTALLTEVKTNGTFTIYALGPAGAPYSFTLHQGVLVMVLAGGV